jgi:hypothetical protein
LNSEEIRNRWINADINTPFPDISFKEWEDWGKRLVLVRDRVGWKLAQWLAFGERKWKQTYIQVAEDLQVGRNYLYNATRIARAFENVALCNTVPFWHYRELANKGLTKDDRILLLEQVAISKLTQEQTGVLVTNYIAAKELPDCPHEEPQWTGGKFGNGNPEPEPEPEPEVQPETPQDAAPVDATPPPNPPQETVKSQPVTIPIDAASCISFSQSALKALDKIVQRHNQNGEHHTRQTFLEWVIFEMEDELK